MAQQNLDTGTRGNNLTGDDLNEAAVKIEANFTDLYTEKAGRTENNTFSGINSFNTLRVNDSVGNTVLTLRKTLSNSLNITPFTSDFANIYVEPLGSLSVAYNTVGAGDVNWTLYSGDLTASRAFSFPDQSGTLALTSDLATSTDFVDLTTNQSIAGDKTFTGSSIFVDTNITGNLTTTGTVSLQNSDVNLPGDLTTPNQQTIITGGADPTGQATLHFNPNGTTVPLTATPTDLTYNSVSLVPESGTFTPTITPNTSGSYSTGTTLGVYTRVGDQVTVHIYFNNIVGTSPVGQLRVGGLPYNIVSSSATPSGVASMTGGDVNFYSVSCEGISGSDELLFRYQDSLDASNVVTMTDVNFTAGIIRTSLTYRRA